MKKQLLITCLLSFPLLTVMAQKNVGIGTASPTARLHVIGDSTNTVISAQVTYVGGDDDITGISTVANHGAGLGIGIDAIGGWKGGQFLALPGAYNGHAYGIFSEAAGFGPGTRIGVYGFAIGGSANWGGYFPEKTYTNELRVGTETGVPGSVATINGKTSINGTMSVNGGNGDAFLILNGGDTRIFDDAGTSSVLLAAGPPSVVGAGVGPNNAVLHVFSDGKAFSFYGNGLTTNSDARLKEDITPLTNSLQKVMQLNGYSYRFKTKAAAGQKEIGILAQEVKKVLPEAVYTDDKGMYSVTYNALVPLLINAIKEQQVEIDKLKEKLDQQQDIVGRLKQLEMIVMKQQKADEAVGRR